MSNTSYLNHAMTVARFAIGVLLVPLAACGPSNGGTSATSSTGIINGLEVTVIVDGNEGGEGGSIILEEVRYGRLVDVYDEENRDGKPSTREVRTLQRTDFLINQALATDGVNYRLETDPITQKSELTIIADQDGDYIVPLDSITQETRFTLLFNSIVDGASVLPINGTDASSMPPFPMVPRNAAFSLRFSDLLDASTINSSTVSLATGVPPVLKSEARVFADRNFGAFLDGTFHPTRIIIDTTVSEFEASAGVLAVNSLGMPPGVSDGVASGALRIPTSPSPAIGQFQVLRNLTGHGVEFTNNGPNEINLTLDVVRSFRAGTSSDDNNGFLPDSEAPTVRGVQVVSIPSTPMSVAPDASLGEIALGTEPDRVFLVSLDFQTTSCAQTPRVGDLLTVAGSTIPEVFAQVTLGAAPPQGGIASDVRVRLLRFPATASLADLQTEFLSAKSGNFESTFVPGPGLTGDCFVQISPPPTLPPTRGVSSSPRISLRFSEAIDPDSIRPFDNLRLDRVAGTPTPMDIVVGTVSHTPDLREFHYTPTTPLDHQQNDAANEYFFNLAGSIGGVTDLAGNPLVDSLPADVKLTIDPNALTTRSGGIVFRFDAINEFGLFDSDTNPAPEVRGQFRRDLARGVIMPRPVTRLANVIDENTNPNFWVNAFAVPTPAAAQPTPMSHKGSRLMTVWRHCDVGFDILDEETANMDIEGISWSPSAPNVSTAFYADFEMTLSHSNRLPDDLSALDSGLLPTFDNNALADPDNVRRVVHAREDGYLIDPTQQFTSSTGRQMMPYPMNRSGSAADFKYLTWRDTAIVGVGGADGLGAEVQSYLFSAGFAIPPPTPCLDIGNSIPGQIYPAGGVRSLALPLLMEFKCYSGNGPDPNNPATFTMFTSSYRAYSTGGLLGGAGQSIEKNPDTELMATGLTTGSLPGNDSVAYAGQLDTVVRVSRVHTRWLDTGATVSGFPIYSPAVVEPAAFDQPAGTSISLAYRGADMVATNLPPPDGSALDIEIATLYDAYGDPLSVTLVDINFNTCSGPMAPDDDIFTDIDAKIFPTFFMGDATWKSNVTDLNGAQFIQVRITFTSNAATLQEPELSTLAIPFISG